MFGRKKSGEVPAPEWGVDEVSRSSEPVEHPRLPADLVDTGWTGTSFGRGVIRFHDAASARLAGQNVEATFGVQPDQVAWFADDWLGRQFGSTTSQEGDVLVVAADLGSGDLRPFLRWTDFKRGVETGEIARHVNGQGLSVFLHMEGLDVLPVDKCASFKHPPVLGGDTSTANLELSDVDVYWGVIGQVLRGLAAQADEG